MVALATEQCARVLVKVRHWLTTSNLRRSKYPFTIIESGRERESVDTADRVLSNLRDLPHSIDNSDAAIIDMLAERFPRNYRGDASSRRPVLWAAVRGGTNMNLAAEASSIYG
jgi:hypothetical protein